jgi:RNA polymerase sigma-70 factor (ECF subfamily)
LAIEFLRGYARITRGSCEGGGHVPEDNPGAEIDDRFRWKTVVKRIARLVHDPTQAEDYLHSAFIKLEEYRSQHVVNNPAAFLVKAAVNIAIDDSRSRRVRNDAQQTLRGLLNDTRHHAVEHEALEARARLLRVREGLSKLPERTRQIFLMHRMDGMKYREIAQALNVSVSTVEKDIAKAVLFITEWTDGW